ncbi:MAG: hypothetical protein Q9186_006872 [Xanthomendoza sp. 1 TL-2023]
MTVPNDKSWSEHDLLPPETSPMVALKDRIRHHYELASEYYYTLWGEHIHHGYFRAPSDTKERAQLRLIELLIERSQLETGSTVLDVGCGIGGTSRYLARNHDCKVTGITISGKQVEMAIKLTCDSGINTNSPMATDFTNPGSGSALFHEVDAETMTDFFPGEGAFDCVWISEALSHLPDKALFFRNAFKVLKSHPEHTEQPGKLVVADWFKAEDLTEKQLEDDIKPIEGIVHQLSLLPCLNVLLNPMQTLATHLLVLWRSNVKNTTKTKDFAFGNRGVSEAGSDHVKEMIRDEKA